jgi:2-pyrone-4,6-dicarboxylate lactonase
VPKIQLPRGACDSHFHVFGPAARFPFAPERAYTPEDRPKEQLLALHRSLGIERGVVVQSAAHGFDNSAAADLIASTRGKYVGVAWARPMVGSDELRMLHAEGFRGVRFNYMEHLGEGSPIGEVVKLSNRLADFGWHLQIHMDSSLVESLGNELRKSAVPVVIDHMGRVDASKGLEQKPFQVLMRLLDNRNFHVKVSCCERASRKGPPYEDAVPFARELVQRFPQQTLWGTDWPHPNVTPVPDDHLLVDLLQEIAPSESQRKTLLVDNPERFYGFKA